MQFEMLPGALLLEVLYVRVNGVSIVVYIKEKYMQKCVPFFYAL